MLYNHSRGAFATMIEKPAANADVGAVVGLGRCTGSTFLSVLSGFSSVSRRLQFTDIHTRLTGCMVASLRVPAMNWQRVQCVTSPPATHERRISGRLRFCFCLREVLLPLLLTGLFAELYILVLIKLTLLLVLSYLALGRPLETSSELSSNLP